MKVSGKIVRKRAYFDCEDLNVDSIIFLEVDNGLEINGDKIKIIPILGRDAQIPHRVGESVEVEGEIVFRKIVTSSGKRNSSPVPTLRLTRASIAS